MPVESRTCLICKEYYIKDEEHFLMYCQGYNNLRSKLLSLVSKTDAHCATSINRL